MESPDPDLSHALDGDSATLEDLQAVLSRHRRKGLRNFLLGGAAAVILAGGVAYGVTTATNSPGGTTINAASGNTGSAAPQASSGVAFATPGGSVKSDGGLANETQLLVRNADDGVRVRLYKAQTCTGSSCPPANGCFPTQIVSSQVSDDQVAGDASFPDWTSSSATPASAFDPVAAMIVGSGEPQPILTVIVRTDPSVTKVTLTTPYGTDSAAPSDGWANLAIQLPQGQGNDLPTGTVTGYSSSGATVGTSTLQAIAGSQKLPATCTPEAMCQAKAAQANTNGQKVATDCQGCQVMPDNAGGGGSGAGTPVTVTSEANSGTATSGTPSSGTDKTPPPGSSGVITCSSSSSANAGPAIHLQPAAGSTPTTAP